MLCRLFFSLQGQQSWMLLHESEEMQYHYMPWALYTFLVIQTSLWSFFNNWEGVASLAWGVMWHPIF